MNLIHRNYFFVIISILILGIQCSSEKKNINNTLFDLIDADKTNIHFTNNVKENLYFNFLNYTYIYNGGGVAVGDINNDGLEDIFFTSNQEANKLYLNKGNFEFKDISKKAKIEDATGWTTGVTMVDINNDGWLDIYVCKSGSLNNLVKRRNKLFINQKNNTFKESAREYGLDHFGFSTQAYFFDFDNDDDLDMYLVNHRKDFRIRKDAEPYNTDKLFRNDNGKFTNITKEAGLNKKGWGLSASIGDFNNDNLLDIYVANDFVDPDFLYINQGDGTFKDKALQHFNHISSNSMGSDFVDINNDLLPDLLVLDMMAEDHIRGKKNMATMSISNFNKIVNRGHHYQYMSNVLQLNNGDGTFSEIGQLSGISKTDWSWAPLVVDFDNDGFNDVFVTNGIQHDLSNQDFRNQMRANIRNRKKVSLEAAIGMIPSDTLTNYIFKNNKDLTFKNNTKKWGLDQKVNSNGAAYADLDNDGDLDLIINNQGFKASIYRNNSNKNFLNILFKGHPKNKNGIGAKATIFSENLQQIKRLFVSRGFQSSVTNKLHFGLGKQTQIDSILIDWGNNKYQKFTNTTINRLLIVDYNDAKEKGLFTSKNESFFEKIIPEEKGINYQQKENDFDDFQVQLLLPQKQSEKGNPLAVGDLNNDGLDDFFVGNSKGQKGAIYIQNKSGKFKETNQKLFNLDKGFEDTDAKFLDIDADGDLDLYVTSGGYEVNNSKQLQDRLYINNGKGNFKKSSFNTDLINSKGIAFADYDKDGDIDVFVGGNVKHAHYPLSDKPYFLENNKGKFTNVIDVVFDDILNLKMINDAIFSDYDNDGDLDLIIVGEWMSIVFYENKDNRFYAKNIEGVSNMNGWFQSITASDLNKDGHIDYIIGNWGSNNKFHPKKEKPLHIYADYFDDNSSFDIALSKVSKTGDLLPVRGKECSTQQTPFLKDKIKTFNEFANSTMPEIYGETNLKNATHYKAHVFSSFVLKNLTNGKFNIEKLPNQAQFSPTLATQVADINNDGFLDIFGVGNVYDAEVETIRYDASKGYVLLGSVSGNFKFLIDDSYYNNKEAKSIQKIIIGGKLHFIILNKNSTITLLRAKNAKI